MRDLTRDDIESSKMVGRRWRAIANQLSEPLRHVRKVSLEQSRSEAKQSRLTLIVELASGRDLLHKGTLADVAALLNVATRYAFIGTSGLRGRFYHRFLHTKYNSFQSTSAPPRL